MWGLIGLFVKPLLAVGFSPLQVAALRVTIGALLLGLFLLMQDRSLLAIRLRDVPILAGTGIAGIAFFNWCYFSSISSGPISVATALLYTSPVFVNFFAWLFLHERLTAGKIGNIVLNGLGCLFVTGVLPATEAHVSPFNLATGLGAGVGYALYSLLSKRALLRLEPVTVTLYSFLFAGLFLAPISGLSPPFGFGFDDRAWLYLLGLGLFPTALAFLAYARGLKRMETGRASIMATIEPVVAVIVGAGAFGERLSFWQLAGIALILASACAGKIERREKL